nr:hypothetical protein BaRGS_008661 [Batillaria attramentaria]
MQAMQYRDELKPNNLYDEFKKREIVDAAGHEYVRSLIKTLYRDVQAVLIVFDVTREDTFAAVEEWRKQIDLVNANSPVVFLVGNKQDLESLRTVEHEQANMESQRLSLRYFETSARSGHNVQETFGALLEEAWRQCCCYYYYYYYYCCYYCCCYYYYYYYYCCCYYCCCYYYCCYYYCCCYYCCCYYYCCYYYCCYYYYYFYYHYYYYYYCCCYYCCCYYYCCYYYYCCCYYYYFYYHYYYYYYCCCYYYCCY